MIDCKDCPACCCRHLDRFPYMKDYDRGDGTCKYLSWENRCVIYSERPTICNMDLMYERYFSKTMSRQEYDAINSGACAALKDAHQTYKHGVNI